MSEPTIAVSEVKRLLKVWIEQTRPEVVEVDYLFLVRMLCECRLQFLNFPLQLCRRSRSLEGVFRTHPGNLSRTRNRTRRPGRHRCFTGGDPVNIYRDLENEIYGPTNRPFEERLATVGWVGGNLEIVLLSEAIQNLSDEECERLIEVLVKTAKDTISSEVNQ